MSDLADRCALDGRQEGGHGWQQVAFAVGPCPEHDDRDTGGSDILLVCQVAVDGNEDAKACIEHEAQELTVAVPGPSFPSRSGNVVPGQRTPQLARHAFVEEHPHARAQAARM